ncbi:MULTISPECIES: YiiX/YebB-like N1pC/P60 family cysteine hydrolase [Cysteiniphilum]|uniref:YiiX/YebB-like N1pC/P60 family cysteine hydrolase n=1 Tax=Cysteiniphilum TaxID=2056696 RepID=UPI00177F6F78|nr:MULTISPECIES: YiiX/YebB-like N1pC/P60 family cysteine hydrolase [Cysteiniphilum]
MLLRNSLSKYLIRFLTHNVDKPRKLALSDYQSLSRAVLPCDVLLVEGRSRTARVISYITRSIWTHTALYIGKLSELEPQLQHALLQFNPHLNPEHIIIESILGEGVVVKNLNEYTHEHIRICRPKGISKAQVITVFNYAIANLGKPYDHRQVFDLARFLFPWMILPRKWRSSIFQHNAKGHAKMTCSLLLAQAFIQARFPILPTIERRSSGNYFEAIVRNPRLFVPCDFDYSPFFDIVKYPMILIEGNSDQLFLWNNKVMSNDGEGLTKISPSNKVKHSSG